jgi:hypothetical protein
MPTRKCATTKGCFASTVGPPRLRVPAGRNGGSAVRGRSTNTFLMVEIVVVARAARTDDPRDRPVRERMAARDRWSQGRGGRGRMLSDKEWIGVTIAGADGPADQDHPATCAWEGFHGGGMMRTPRSAVSRMPGDERWLLVSIRRLASAAGHEPQEEHRHRGDFTVYAY